MENPENDGIAENVMNSVLEQNAALDDVDGEDVVTFDITLYEIRGKAQVAVNAPTAIATEAVDFVNAEVKPEIDERYATNQGEKIGELRVAGNGTIEGAEIKDEFKI